MGGIAQTLAHIGNRMREDHLLDLQDRKSQQDRSLKFLEAAMQNPGVDPESQQGLFDLYMQANTTPLDKWDAKKVSKGMADIMSQYHDRAVQGAQQNAEKQPGNLSFPIPGGNYDAGGFESHPPMAPAAPPGQPQLPSAQLPEPPQYRASSPAQMPGMPTAMEMPGIPAPGPEVPGAVQPFISPQRAAQAAQQAQQQQLQAAAESLKALGITDPRDIVNAINKQSLPRQAANAATPAGLIKLGANDVLFDPETRQPVFSAPGSATADKFVNVPGVGLVNPATKEVVIPTPAGATPDRNVPVDQQAFKGYLDKAGGDPVRARQMMKADDEKGKGPTATQITRADNKREAATIADEIINGNQPPVLTGLYGKGADVREALGKKGYDLSKATLDWEATKRWISTQNGQSQLRIRQAAEFAFESLDLIDNLNEDLSKKIPRGQFPVANKLSLIAAKNGVLGPEAQQAATNLEIQITDLQSELASVYKGGNSPTDQGLKRASEILASNWTKDQLKAATDLARKNLRVRLNSIRNVGVASGMDNIYSQGRTGGATSDTPPNPPAGGEKMRVRRKADGKTGSINPVDFDPAKYDKL